MKHYKNIRFCLQNCANMTCERNKKHLDNRPVAEALEPVKFVALNSCKRRIVPSKEGK